LFQLVGGRLSSRKGLFPPIIVGPAGAEPPEGGFRMTVESSSPKLRPLNLGELLDRIVRLYRQNFLTFIGIVAIVQVPVILIQLLFSLTSWGRAAQGGFDPTFSTGRSTEALGGSLVNILIAILSLILVQGIGTAAMTRAIANNYMGRKTGITEAYRQIGDVWLPLIGALLLSGIVVIAVFVWWIVPCVGWNENRTRQI
jgi:hypothetical protein